MLHAFPPLRANRPYHGSWRQSYPRLWIQYPRYTQPPSAAASLGVCCCFRCCFLRSQEPVVCNPSRQQQQQRVVLRPGLLEVFFCMEFLCHTGSNWLEWQLSCFPDLSPGFWDLPPASWVGSSVTGTACIKYFGGEIGGAIRVDASAAAILCLWSLVGWPAIPSYEGTIMR